MNTKKDFSKITAHAERIAAKSNSLLTESNYLKLAACDKNFRNLLSSTAILMSRYTELTIDFHKLLGEVKELSKEVEIHRDELSVVINQINSANSQLLEFSNSLSTFTCLLKMFHKI